MARRVGIFGGVFDPIHIGHAALAGAAMSRFRLDRLYVVPSGNPPHKTGITLPADARFRLVRAAFDGLPFVTVSDIETSRTGVSYTFETVEAIARQENTRPYFFMGADNIPEIAGWKHPERIFAASYVVAVTRPGSDLSAAHPEYQGLITPLDMAPVPVSSSDIRCKLRQGLDVSDLLPAGVLDLIRQNRWYA